jgi:hypothetical protein
MCTVPLPPGVYPIAVDIYISKYLESFKMWCWRRMEKISLTDHMRNEESRRRGISCKQ